MNSKEIYENIVTWLITAAPRVLFALVLFIAGQWFIRLVKKGTLRSLHEKKFAPSLRPFLMSLLFTTLQILLAVAIMNVLGIQMSLFAALLASIGVAAGLALSGTLQNFTSGILILLLKPYKVGDNIIAQAQEGTVTAIQIFFTVLTTYDNRVVIIPNSKLSNELIINISQEGSRRLDTELKFPFSADYARVKEVLTTMIHENKEILGKPASRIGVSSLEPDGYKVMVNVWVKAHGFEDCKLLLREKLLQGLVASGIKLPGL